MKEKNIVVLLGTRLHTQLFTTMYVQLKSVYLVLTTYQLQETIGRQFHAPNSMWSIYLPPNECREQLITAGVHISMRAIKF